MYITCLTPTELELMSENKLNKEKRTLPFSLSSLTLVNDWVTAHAEWIASEVWKAI